MLRDSRSQLPDSATGVLAVVGLATWLQAAFPSFEPVQSDVLGLGGALVNAWADVELDGDPDLFVGFGGAPNRLYRNDSGVLVDAAGALGVADARATRAAAWGDYDGDGDADLLVGFAPADASVLKLYRNERTRFVDITAGAGLTRAGGAVRQPVWVDFDADGDLDLFVAFRDGPNAMFQNTGGRFEDRAPALGLDDGRRSVGATWFDADDDGDLDLYVANMDGDANGFFVNTTIRGSAFAVPADRPFVDVARSAGLESGGRAIGDAAQGTVRPCVADVDGDGRLDVFTANYGPNGLFLNRGGGRWEDVSRAWGASIDGRHDTCAFADVDHDGRPDAYVNGTFTGGTQYPDFLFRNEGNRFADVTPDSIRRLNASHGASWADLDGDGDLDLALAGTRPDAMHFVMRNGLSGEAAGRSLFVRVDASAHRGHPGATVTVSDPTTGRLIGAQAVDAGSGYDAQHDVPLHFGLPSVTVVRVRVRYAHNGHDYGVEREIKPAEYRGRVLVIVAGGPSGSGIQ